jgi:hypothetical protein
VEDSALFTQAGGNVDGRRERGDGEMAGQEGSKETRRREVLCGESPKRVHFSAPHAQSYARTQPFY